MKNKLINSLKYFLAAHVILFVLLMLYVLFVIIVRSKFYMFDDRMPWQETYLNKPLNLLIGLNMMLYWSKSFLILFLLVFIINKKKLTKKIILLGILTLVIYILIRTNAMHLFVNNILHGYDVNSFSLTPEHYKFF